MSEIQYRIIWSVGGGEDGSDPFTGDWAPLQWTFDHMKAAGDTTGHGKIYVDQATEVEFRKVDR